MLYETGNPHKKLNAWKLSIKFVASIYKHLQSFPKEEKYGIISQMQRCAVSIPANIAEGAARGSKKEFRQFVYISRGSLSELDSYLEISSELGYLTTEDYKELENELSTIGRLLTGLIKSLSN